MTTVEIIETPSLGDRSYLVHDGAVGVVVDPQRDYDRVLAAAQGAGVRISHVLETHLHNDYVTGGGALARATGATYVTAADDPVAVDRVGVGDGDRFQTGKLSVTVLATPGHTLTHLAYLVGEPGATPAVFTGGSLLYGTVGRTDLLGSDLAEQLTRAQFRSARRLIGELPPDTGVFPTHGFGSFCSTAPSTAASAGTIADERAGNVAVGVVDEDEFVQRLLASLVAYPRYYQHMAALNLAGPPPPDFTPAKPVDADELRARLAAGDWVVDLRDRVTFARQHLRGTVNIELAGPFATYLGWVVPWGAPVTLLGDDAGQIAEAQRELVRIGIDRLAGAASGGPRRWGQESDLASFRVADFEELRAALAGGEQLTILDVRRDDEWADGHLPGARHIPLPDLAERLAELPLGSIWVHCAGGFRAAIGASIVARARRDVVHVDADFATAAEAGLPIQSGARAPATS